MNLFYILVIAAVIAALYWAWTLVRTHGVWSLTTWLGPAAVILVALMFLWLLNNFGMRALRTQAEGSVSQMQDMLHQGLPALISESGQISVPQGIAGESQADQDPNVGGQQYQSLPGQQALPEATPVPIAPPQAGEVRQIGNPYPAYGDPLIPLQAQCMNRTDIINTLTSAGALPNGIQLTMWTGQATFFVPVGGEKWDVKVVLPSAQLAPVHYMVDGLTYRAMAKGCGGNSCTGHAAWPTVTAIFDGTNWTPVQPLECQFH